MRTYLVEHYWPGATSASYADAMARVTSSIVEMAATGAQIRFLHSTFIPGDEAALAVLLADDEGRVREAYRLAGVAWDRVSEAVDSTEAEQPMSSDAKPKARPSR